MNVRFVDVGADHKGVFAFGEAFGKFHAQPVGFLRGDLAGSERLAHMVGDHIILAAHPPGGGDVLALCQQKFRVGSPAVAAIAGNEPAIVRFLRVFHIVDDVADGFALGAAFANMQRYDAGGGHKGTSFSKRKGQPCELSFSQSDFSISCCVFRDSILSTPKQAKIRIRLLTSEAK